MKMRSPSGILLCSGLVSLLLAQPAPPDRNCDNAGKNGGPRPPMVAPFGPGGPTARQQPIMMDIEEMKTVLNEIKVDKPSIDKTVEITRNFLSQLDGRLIKVQREELNIREELLKDKPDLSAVQGYINRKSQVFAEIEFSQIKRDVEIKALLSRDEYDALKSAMMRKMKHMRPFADEAADKPEGGKPPKFR